MTTNQTELFDPPGELKTIELLTLFESWAASSPGKGGALSDASTAVYRDMWVALIKWSDTQRISVLRITAAQLDAYLRSRGGSDDLDNRYAWRLLRLVERVFHHVLPNGERGANQAVADLLRLRPDLKYANASERDQLPEFLEASDARALVAHLATPPRTGSWRELRDRAAIALHLGAGLTPAEVRSLQLASVHGLTTGTKKIRVAGNGTVAAHEAPVAAWAWTVLKAWLQARAEADIAGDLLLPSTRAGREWGKTAHYDAVASVLEAVGLPANGGAYRLRHTFALRQLKRGRSASELAGWLGIDDSEVARYRRLVSGPVAVE